MHDGLTAKHDSLSLDISRP